MVITQLRAVSICIYMRNISWEMLVLYILLKKKKKKMLVLLRCFLFL